MGWSRSQFTLRLYQDRRDKSYLLVDPHGEALRYGGGYDGVANVLTGPEPSLGSSTVGPAYLTDRCRRVAWNDLPTNWKRAMREWLRVPPCKIRGFWRKGHRNNPRRRS